MKETSYLSPFTDSVLTYNLRKYRQFIIATTRTDRYKYSLMQYGTTE